MSLASRSPQTLHHPDGGWNAAAVVMEMAMVIANISSAGVWRVGGVDDGPLGGALIPLLQERLNAAQEG